MYMMISCICWVSVVFVDEVVVDSGSDGFEIWVLLEIEWFYEDEYIIGVIKLGILFVSIVICVF